MVSPGEVAKAVKSVVVHWLAFTAHPKATLTALIDRMEELEGVELQAMPCPDPKVVDYYDRLISVEGSERHIMVHDWFITIPASRELYRLGRADYTPNHFRECPRLVQEFAVPDVVMMAVSRVDEHGFCSFGMGCAYTRAKIDGCKKKGNKVILEVNEQIPCLPGNCFGSHFRSRFYC